MSDAIAPGAWVCDKCGFQLQKNILYAGDGSIGADTSPLNERCPNDNVLMRPTTWREMNEELFKRCEKLMGENDVLRRAAMWLCCEVSTHSIECTCGSCCAACEAAPLLPELAHRFVERFERKAAVQEIIKARKMRE